MAETIIIYLAFFNEAKETFYGGHLHYQLD